MTLGREHVVRPGVRLALALGALVPTMCGAAVIGVLASRALPTGAALGEPDVLRVNVVAATLFVATAVPPACAFGVRWTTVRAPATEAFRHAALMTIPARLTLLSATVWTSAAVLLAIVNVRRPWLATTLGIATLLGGTVTATLTYWWCTRVLRPHVAPVLTEHPPSRQQRPGLRLRAVAAWVVGTGVPLLMLLLVAASALVVDYPGDRLAVAVLGLGGAAVLSGLTVTIFTGATTADPIEEVRDGMGGSQKATTTSLCRYSMPPSSVCMQAGFNSMAEGLRGRERLRDLFGRQVGREVARLAEESSAPQMGGVNCEVAVVFVDLVGSTRMALDMPPQDLVALLNEFFAVVVDIVERHRGWVNKFEGDAALAIFGAPQPIPDHAGAALAAARELSATLASGRLRLSAGIGVSAGTAVAGNVGDLRRYEYTVIGDPVNEAARLSEYAKTEGGVAASGTALALAGDRETAHWQVVAARTLRGRDTATDIATPLG
ncbi:adenylate/guanylate cyclase domain-containing protein [Mycobacterium sp.]|uniref:adenylate/guanylate cyclase domain-containing protein n=1 Tax=Mycobacterium sp. TaxID=1785 RepID=UPI0025F63B89|nr:adenylate/guanylate cyclase domain-containing protein [Mycobacterium sp.]